MALLSNAFLSDAGKEALTGAIQAVEAQSSAEIVVVVRARSRGYAATGLVASWVAALAMLVFLLYSPIAFGLHRFLLDVALAGGIVGVLVTAVPALTRLLTPRSAQQAAVDDAAAATFFQQGMRLTTERIGVLVYVSLLERQVKVLADVGVRDAVDVEAWAAATAAIDQTLKQGADASLLAERIKALAGLLSPALPRSDDDVNELPDAVVS